jgi:hypothetical protein
VNPKLIFQRSSTALFCGLTLFVSFAAAQRTAPTPVKVILNEAKPMAVATRNNLYCAGYVQSSPIDTSNKIVGGLEEQEQFVYAQNDVVYLNMGAGKGVKVGDMLSVVRPRGKVDTRWTRKGQLGFFIQEVGAVEVISVKDDVSAARIRTSCDNFLLGDLVQPLSERTSPLHQVRGPLDVFTDSSGKATGRVFMARDGQEMLTRDQIVYVDLGAEDDVKVGDYLTVFRPLGEGNILLGDQKETVSAGYGGYQSSKYSGGKFSTLAGRKSGDRAGGAVVTTSGTKGGRPAIRKVVGELVVLNVKEKTATAVITRTAQEIHTGDWVEVQ